MDSRQKVDDCNPIEATQKQVDYVEVRDKTSNELELYDRYITMTLKKFKCAECSKEVSNAECCKIKDCSPTCLDGKSDCTILTSSCHPLTPI